MVKKQLILEKDDEIMTNAAIGTHQYTLIYNNNVCIEFLSNNTDHRLRYGIKVILIVTNIKLKLHPVHMTLWPSG